MAEKVSIIRIIIGSNDERKSNIKRLKSQFENDNGEAAE